MVLLVEEVSSRNLQAASPTEVKPELRINFFLFDKILDSLEVDEIRLATLISRMDGIDNRVRVLENAGSGSEGKLFSGKRGFPDS